MRVYGFELIGMLSDRTHTKGGSSKIYYGMKGD